MLNKDLLPQQAEDPPMLTRRAALARGAAAVGSFSAVGMGATRAFGSPTSELSPVVLSQITEARKVSKFVPPGPAFDASKAKGKTVFYVSNTFAVSIVQTLYNGVKEAAAAAGVETLSFDAKGQPDLMLVGMKQAINQKPDLILVESIENTLINQQIREARKAGIKVVMLNEKWIDGPGLEPVDGRVAFDYVGGARMEANYVLADSGGKNINLVVFQAASHRHDDMSAEITKQINEYAIGGAKLEVKVLPFSDFATRLPTLTRSMLTADPTINYMVTTIDGMSLYVIPAIHQAGAQDRVKLATYNGTPSVLGYLNRKDVVIADTGGANTWEGWTDMDQALRILTGNPPVPGESTPPNRAFDRTNIGSINLEQPEEVWYDTDAAKSQFRKLWGLG